MGSFAFTVLAIFIHLVENTRPPTRFFALGMSWIEGLRLTLDHGWQFLLLLD